MGSVYAANTLGAIFGALIVSLVLIPVDRHAEFAARAGLGRRWQAGVLILVPYVRAQRSHERVCRARGLGGAGGMALRQPLAPFPAS